MEQEKCGRGRPKIDTHITEVGAPSRRQAINALLCFTALIPGAIQGLVISTTLTAGNKLSAAEM